MTNEDMNQMLSAALKTTVNRRVDSVLALASIDMDGDPDSKYWSLDQNDEGVLKRLRQRAKTKDISLSDLDEVLQEESEALMQIMRKGHEKRLKAIAVHPRKCRVYDVYNTAERSLQVLAIDNESARYHALQSRHIQSEKNGRLMVYSEEWQDKEMKSGSVICQRSFAASA